MVVADASVAAIADVVLGKDVLFINIPEGAIGGGVLANTRVSAKRSCYRR